MEWHSKSLEEIYGELSTGESGLSEVEARRRLLDAGENKLPEPKRPTIIWLFIRQFESPLIYILLIASVIVLIMGDVTDSIVIAAVLIINALIGAIQEGRAENALSALRNFVKTDAVVVRGEKEIIIPDNELVPGDIIILKEGDKVPADARIVHEESLTIDESELTGESEPVLKNSKIILSKEETSIDKTNMVFNGTFVVRGNGRAVVVETGIHTLIGKISVELSSIDTEIPLKADIRRLSKIIILVVSALVAFMFFVGIGNGTPVREMFSIAVAMAVSAIPEGLPVVVTLILATGVYRMGKRNALIKKLQAVEALGQADVIAVDKTGTITLNQMTVNEIYTRGEFYTVTGSGYEPKGEIMKNGEVIEHLDCPELMFAGKVASLSSSARFAYSEEKKEWLRVSGDPTEVALLVFSEKIGFSREALDKESPLMLEIPFDSRTKYHATINPIGGVPTLLVSGAPESVLLKTTSIWSPDVKRECSPKDIDDLKAVLEDMSSRGLRVIALAVKEHSEKMVEPFVLPELSFVALVGIADALREEAFSSIEAALRAGVRVVMITGDHATTARTIALKAGIYHEGDTVITGQDLDTMDETELLKRIKTTSVFARVTPEHKLSIIKAYKSAGLVIAMTGDGVNDALSLSAADLGISMGKIGTEVAKEASDIILLDDNFSSIVSAIEEGRNIYKTIKKVIVYLFSTSFGEMLAIIGAMLLGFPIPLSASQIIWLNFITDGFLVAALAMEPKEKDLLSVKKTKDDKKMVTLKMFVRMVIMGVMMMIGTLVVFSHYTDDYVKASTMALTVLAVFQWVNVLNCRSDKKSVFSMNLFENKFLVLAFVGVIALQIMAVYTPIFKTFLKTTPLSLEEWFIAGGVSLTVVLVDELFKLIDNTSFRLKKLAPLAGK